MSSVLLRSLPSVGSPEWGSTPPFRLPQAFLLCRAWELKLSVPDPFAARVWGQVSLHQAQSHRAGGERGAWAPCCRVWATCQGWDPQHGFQRHLWGDF